MQLAYLGLPEGASALLAAGHRVLAAGLDGGSAVATERARLELEQGGMPVRARPSLADAEEARFLTAAGAPLLVCYLYGRLLPPELLASFPEGALSYHPSLLPRHRGPDPYFWTIYSGDAEAGVSLLWLDAAMDTGPVVEQRRLAVDPSWTAGRLAERLDSLGLALLLEVLEREGGPGPGRPQPDAGATLAPFPDEDLLEIRWSSTADEVVRLVKAASPHPGAFTYSGGEPLIVLEARLTTVERPGALEPGDAVLVAEGLLVMAGSGGLILEEVLTASGRRLAGLSVAEAFPGVSDLRHR